MAAVGLGLMLLPEEKPEPEPAVITADVPDLEERLETLLGQIEGAGQVHVLLTEESGRETVFQTNGEDTVLVETAERSESGLVRQTLEPTYRGAVILCQGADRPSVKLAIVEAVACVTGLGADAISVLKMK